jgi:hypothetical protein
MKIEEVTSLIGELPDIWRSGVDGDVQILRLSGIVLGHMFQVEPGAHRFPKIPGCHRLDLGS